MNRAIFVIALTPSDALMDLLRDRDATTAERLYAIGQEVDQPDSTIFDCITATYNDEVIADHVTASGVSPEVAITLYDSELIRELLIQGLAAIQTEEIRRRATTAPESSSEH